MRKFLVSNIPVYILISGLVIMAMLFTHPLGFNNYGYDYGFYSYAVQHTPLDSPAYFAGQVNDYGNHLFVILNWLRLPQVQTLDILFLLFFISSEILFYEILKKYGWLVSGTGVTLLILSIAQNQLYSMFLWKAAYGQVLLLLIFFLIQEQKKYHWELLPLLLLFITHKTTSIMALAALTPHYLFATIKNKKVVILTVAIAGLFFFLGLNGLNYTKQLLHSEVQNGLFLNIGLYLKYSWYLLPLASFGAYQSYKTRRNLPWLGLLTVSLLFIIFKITFYQRIILYADLALIYFSALTIYQQRNNLRAQKILVILTLFIAFSNFLFFTKTDSKPEVTDQEITEIQNFSQSHQGAFVLSLSAQDGPWLLANLNGNIRLAAPGLFEDKYSEQTWKTFWTNPKNQTFFEPYPKPLYLYERSTIFFSQPTEQLWQCLDKVSDHFYQYICVN